MDPGESTEESPVQTKIGELPRTRKASDRNQESLAGFFAENKKIAGFDNPGKSLYSTVRELVENALDSAEIGMELPLVEVTIEELYWTQSTLGGIDEKQLGKKVKGGTAYYRVTCKDNGSGLSAHDVDRLFGKALSRKMCGVKQTRGRSGFGAKMAFIWSKMSTGAPVEITTSIKNNRTKYIRVDIDIDRPNFHIYHIEDFETPHGTKIKVVTEGDWKGYSGEILEYMRRMAVITPHATFVFGFVGATTPVFDVRIRYERSTTVLPAVALNPLVEDMSLLIGRLSGSSDQNLLEFIQHEFVDIGREIATKLIGDFMGPDVTYTTQVNSLTAKSILRLKELFRHAIKYSPSRGVGRLIPIGEENLYLGIMAQLRPDMLATFTARGENHPFIVEVGVSLGGKADDDNHGLHVYRFANRVPLLFDEDDDDVTTTVKHKIDWKGYHANPKSQLVRVFVSIVSTKIPFKWPGVECIGDETGEIAVAVKTCIAGCFSVLLPRLDATFQACQRALDSLLSSYNKTNREAQGAT